MQLLYVYILCYKLTREKWGSCFFWQKIEHTPKVYKYFYIP